MLDLAVLIPKIGPHICSRCEKSKVTGSRSEMTDD